MVVTLGSVTYLDAANVGYDIGLDPDGHRVEFIGPWPALAPLQARLDARERVEVDVDGWQVVAVDGELRVALTREAMAARAFLAHQRSGV